MLENIIQYSIRHKLIVILFSVGIIAAGLYSLTQLPIGAVPDVTNNQVQIITTSRNLATADVEKFITYPIELEMANLPQVKEIRSISKFGLSVVTVVFNDEIGTYLPRQLIAEKIKAAEEKIPVGFGKPFMGPITTGLGEIYQYVLEVDSAHRHLYSLSDLRTLQDWVVKRQLSGIPGVVEVNTWGGHLKQYEVAIDPNKLKSHNVSLQQVFAALQQNNSVAGGGYIERNEQTYFIRGEGLAASTNDIASIWIANKNGYPILVRDIAKVNFGYATRFGAITGNGEGEKVLGQVMMLKDANSKQVIDEVKKRVDEISASLPVGVRINPFLERSELIGKTTFTIAENLILGCLIVIFVVVLLLGNWRSGLVVASVIPMCLLFALSLMYLFDVDANLMSLGAIDFGIIIDGAVIIVEYIAFKITTERATLQALSKPDQQAFIDNITHAGASKMMHSAVFGQLIIIIVFIPILSLVGVEGKMFKPMALVFCFALLGAMLLCFTYVPVMASLFIRPSKHDKRGISDQLISRLQATYKPSILFALRHKGLVLGLAISLLVSSILLFSTMGGEFVPTLDEGDFVIQPILKTGTSLTSTTAITTQIEKILVQFPEVEQVVSRIGAAEVPTDPMSMEESDVIIKLKPKSYWVSAQTKDELADTFKAALSVIPGVDYEFTQPIEMRFNELITGVRADVAVKIFGEDLDVLHRKALEVERAIEHIEGAADISVEKIEGLPQMSVTYNRQMLAKHGMNVQQLNEVITMGFAGVAAGVVFEGEKQFDLVVRFDKAHHGDISDLQQASIQTPAGIQLPLSEFASITYSKGPAKIARDNTKRRIVVGVNVRNRDLESVVKDIQQAIDAKVELPKGYTVEYGGQFENLRTAKSRLMIAVPVALLLIFVLLYFTFNSVKEAMIIYSAIPMSAIGGVVLLYLRDLPFSISAGVGFIALFGIAVLNGIVLIEEFKSLKAHGITDIHERIVLGTTNRLRPVLLTASAAALGFLPMAISSSAGAEVQRPLATVVVGGLISATLLTLIVLPVLYAIFDRKRAVKVKKTIVGKGFSLLSILMGLSLSSNAQSSSITIGEAINIAITNNLGLQAAQLQTEQANHLIHSAVNIQKTEVFYGRDNNNIAPNNLPLNVWGVNQSLQFPSLYGAQRNVAKANYQMSTYQLDVYKLQLVKEINLAYQELLYWTYMHQNTSKLDSLYTELAAGISRSFELGQSNQLEALLAQSNQKQISVELEQISQNQKQAALKLNALIQAEEPYTFSTQVFNAIALTPLDSATHPAIQLSLNALAMSQAEVKLAKQQFAPDLNVSLFRGTNNGPGVNAYSGFQFGVALPLWFAADKAQLQAAKVNTEQSVLQFEDFSKRFMANYQSLLIEVSKLKSSLEYYESQGRTLAETMSRQANIAYKKGELNFLQYAQLLDNSAKIHQHYFLALYQYNQAVINANYLIY